MKVNIGIEKECLVFDDDFNPVTIDVESLPPELTVDFANHQLEVVGNVYPDAHCNDRELNRILNHPYFVGKKVWPLSTPRQDNENVYYNLIDGDYRQYLAEKYGITKMLYSGIHFNYSNELLTTEADYFELMRKVYVFLPIIIQFTSFTPFDHHPQPGLTKIGENYGRENSISLRSSNQYGFTNKFPLNIDYTNLETFKKSHQQLVASGQIRDEREIYTKVRLKTKPSNYIELRFVDLNPFYYAGISSAQLVLLEEFLGWLTTYQLRGHLDKPLIQENMERVSLNGLNRSEEYLIDGNSQSLEAHTNWLFTQLLANTTSQINHKALLQLLADYQTQHLDLNIMLNQIRENNLTLQQFGEDNVHTPNVFTDIYPELKMELSTKLIIAEAKKRGYQVDILSEASNIIRVHNDARSEILIEGTRTNADTYANALVINNKQVTKQLLAEANIAVPKGVLLINDQQLTTSFSGKIVIKPLDTNYGLGISIVDATNEREVATALATARTYSNQIIVEEFIAGSEYRFLVIGDEVVSVLTRVNANVIGDGTHNIAELIDLKNQSSMRGTKYRRPLEKIQIDPDLIRVISKANLSLDTIPECGAQINLRETSNVSQGGDSYEVSRIIPRRYKDVALQAVNKLGVKICGVDIIIGENGDYGIIEANFNPAIHMHTYPYVGPSINVAAKLLDLLFAD